MENKKEPNPKQEAETILKRRNLEGTILFATVSGSHAYNLQREDGSSDYDYLAVYCAPPSQFWGLHQPQARVTSKQGQSPDIQVIEVAAFCNALLNANPTFVELLWINEHCWWERFDGDLTGKELRGRTTQEVEGTWDYLRANRKRFLTKELVKQYLGFARGQLKLVEAKPENNSKKIYNALRLLMEAKRVITGAEPIVWMEGSDREFLMSVRRGEKELSAYVEYGKQLISEIEAEEPRSKLLAATDEEWLNNWLLTVRRSGLREVNLARNRSDSLLTHFENFG